jgi:hypothetical protein
VSDEQDGYFSSVDVRFDQATSRFTSRSYLTQLDEWLPAWQAAETNEVALSLIAATDGRSSFVLNGAGSVSTPGGQHSLSTGQYAIPATVPLDRTILTYNLPTAAGSSVRLFVGSIPDKPSWMRVCWNVDVPNTLRVICSRNDRETGAPVGVDAGNDVRGTILTHRSTATETLRWSVLLCYVNGWGVQEVNGQLQSVRFEHSTFRKYAYDRTKPYGGLTSLPRAYPITSTFLTNGDVMHELSDPLGYYRYTIRDGSFIVASEDSHAGGTSGANSDCRLY